MAKRFWAVMGAMAVLGSTAVGCAQNGSPDSEAPAPVPATATLSEGLTVLDTTTDTALNIAFRQNNRVIFMQALRGKLGPAEYQPTDGGAPVYEVDARFVADNGRTFYTRKGGDEWIDRTWPEQLAKEEALPEPTFSNEVLFQMAAEATKLLDVQLAKQLSGEKVALHAPEVNALRTFGNIAVTDFAEQKVRFVEHLKQIGKVATEIPYGSDKGGTDTSDQQMSGGYYYMALHDASISWTFGAKHSATRLHKWNGSSWYTVHDSCNHGRCPFEDGMNVKCNVQYYDALENFKPDWVLQSCKTGYSADSNSGHNCHDDTRVQMANLVFGKVNNGYQEWCNDGDGSSDISGGTERDGSPSCNTTKERGYTYYKKCGYDGGGNVCPSTWLGDGICDCNCKFAEGTNYVWADPDCRGTY